jgi:hypothetical protein
MTAKRTVRRVLLGVGSSSGAEPLLSTAVAIAKGTGARLTCLLIRSEDVMSASRLPFARIIGHGGISMTMSPAEMDACMRSAQRVAETLLAERCSAARIGWNVERPEGDYAHQLLAAAEEGDVVILEREAAPATERDAEPMIAELLRKAAAVVLPGLPSRMRGTAVAVVERDAEEVVSLAQGIAGAVGLPLRCLSFQEFLSASIDCAMLVLPERMAGEMGGLQLVGELVGRSSTLVVVQSRG